MTARRTWAGSAVAAAALQLAACAGAPTVTPLDGRTPGQAGLHGYNRPYVVRGRRYTPAEQPGYDVAGEASWYGYESGRRTADGEAFTLEGLTAAHRTLPIPSWLEVTNLATGRRVVLRLNDRGPFADGRILDVSREAARRLGFLRQGVARVRVRYLGPAPPATRLASQATAPDPLALVADLPSTQAPWRDAQR
jgi:rare lipoprotein A